MDPITREVIRNRLGSIADEMEVTLLRAAYSAIVKEGLDASAALFDPKGRNVAQAAAIPIHLGCLIPAVERVLTLWPADTMKPGDVFILNDPYNGGSHLPDVILVMPVFWEERLTALATTMCHHQEMGGMVAGSLPPDATELFQEGLRIPPMKLVDAGEVVEPILDMLRANVRIPNVVLGDLRAQRAACHTAQRRLHEMYEEFGPSRIQEAIEDVLALSEAMTRDRLQTIPDGSYTFEDYLDDDGVEQGKLLRIRAVVTVTQTDLHVDFEGTSSQTRGPFNCVRSSTLAGVYYVLRVVTGPDIPSNSGCYRPLTLALPEGSLVNPRFPAPVNSRTATVKRISDVLLGCFAQAVPDRLPAASCGQLLVMNFGGVDPETGNAFVTSELGAGGMGGRPGKDGLDCIETDATNCMNVPAEAIEMESPIRIKKWRMWSDSGGAGRWRGGCGMEKVFQVTRGDVTVTYRGERHTTKPWGVAGGRAPESSHAFVLRAGGQRESVASKETLYLHKGDELHVFISGGGGYGDPLDRPAVEVERDVDAGLVSVQKAYDRYGVAMAQNGGIDPECTEQRRAGLRAEREMPELFDFGGGKPWAS